MSSISFDNIYLLFLIIPLVVLFAVPFALAIRRDNVNGHNVASGVLHVIMALLISFAAAGATVVTTKTETDVYVLADVSYSASKNLDAVDGYISDVKKNLPDNSRLGVVCFANGYRMLTRLGGKLVSVREALEDRPGYRALDDGGTDIISVLKYVNEPGFFNSRVIKRVVLITDGRQTSGDNSVTLKEQVDALIANNIHVDAIYLDDNLKEGEEAQLCSADYIQSAYIGSDERASVTVRANSAADAGAIAATITVTRTSYDASGSLLSEQTVSEPVELTRGYNNYNFALDTSAEGRVDYAVELGGFTSFADGNPHNNRLTFTQYVGGRGKTLLVSQREEDYSAIKGLLGESLRDEDCYINNPTVPCSVEKLCAYDEIILSNVNLTSLGDAETFLTSLEAAVSKFGKGLLTFGEVSVQSEDELLVKKLADLLPARYGQSDGGRLFTIVIDASHSMGMADKMAHAKQVAKGLLSLLSAGDSALQPSDEVTLIRFDGEAYPLLTGATVRDDYKRITEEIEGIETGHGTVINGGLQSALDRMTSTTYSDKRLFLISDGIDFPGGMSQEIEATVRQLVANDVLVSSFGTGAENNHAAGVELLKSIAALGGGSFYDVSSDDKAADVVNFDLSREQTALQGGRSRITVKRAADDVLAGVTVNLANTEVYDYVAGKVKASATTVLTVRDPSTGGEAPLYAYWRYGNGKVASFSAGISGSSISYWTSFKNQIYNPFFGNVLSYALPEERIDYPFTLNIADRGGYAEVSVIPPAHSINSSAHLQVIAPSGEEVYSGALALRSAQFEAQPMPVLGGEGNYRFIVDYTLNGATYRAERTLSVSYAAEYDSFAMYDAAVLHNALGANGTVSTDGSLKLENDPAEIGLNYFSLKLPLLIACVVLYFVDIAVRKLKKEDVINLFRKVKK